MGAKTSRGTLTVRILGAVLGAVFAVWATSCAAQLPTNTGPTTQQTVPGQVGTPAPGNR